MSKTWKFILLILLLITITIWLSVLTFPKNKFKIIACDVGQGDAILAIYGSFEILTDGGEPNAKVLECLSRYLPFWDRTIEVIVNTHPQLDHFGGLIKVLQTYNVQYFVGNALISGAQEYQVLMTEVGSKQIKVINPVSGQSIRYNLMHYDIFWPSYAFLASEGESSITNKLGTFTSKRDPNDFSVQALISFGDFTALLAGDVGNNMKDLISPKIPINSLNYIKIPHHGSKNGLTKNYVDILKPQIAVISVGAKNNYGHPNSEILKILTDNNVRIFRTDQKGDVVLETDGVSYTVE
jgi:competence protein ComEC